MIETVPATGNRIHVLASEADATARAAALHGTVREGRGLGALDALRREHR